MIRAFILVLSLLLPFGAQAAKRYRWRSTGR